jgi:putative PIN family toxin of toxin-antitoxin system
VRAVLDVNVIISALLAPTGSPARVVRSWLDGAFELIVSDALLGELERALSYPKVRNRIDAAEGQELVDLLRRSAEMMDDPAEARALRSADPGDDYLIALAALARAVIVSGDRHLLVLAPRVPVWSPAEFLTLLTPDR